MWHLVHRDGAEKDSARATLEEKFSPDSVVHATLDAYKQACRFPPRRDAQQPPTNQPLTLPASNLFS
jgi:hypothetical protein